MTYRNPRLKHVKKIRMMSNAIRYFGKTNIADELDYQCNLLLETKKAKKRKKETYYYRITGIHDDGSLSKTPKTGSFTVTQPDPKEESKKYLWSVADEERLDKKNAPDPKEEMREIEPLSKVVKKDQTDRKFVMCVAEKVEELVERVNILSKSK